jgi:hypothetical protein
VAEAPQEEVPAAAGETGAPDPFNILKNSCNYMAGLKQFSAAVSVTADEILDSGSKIQKTSQRLLSVSRPDRLAVDFTSETKNRRFIYDGQSLMMQNPDKNVYSQVPMPGTIDGMIDTLSKVYGINPPLDDLLYSSPYDGLVAQVETGQYAGESNVLEAACDHLVFTQATTDWEIWIETGNRPLVRKLLIRYKTLPGAPTFMATVTSWNLSPVFPPGTFVATPPAGAEKIEVLPMAQREEAPPPAPVPPPLQAP